MKSHPLVSLVTPAHNQGRFLAETIESVLAQDYPNIEYIVLDDGSTDETPQILETYRNRILSERHDNIGQGATLNKGWGMARGDILGYLSSDDLLAPNAIRTSVEWLENTDAQVVYCDYRLIDVNSRAIRDVRTSNFDKDALRVSLKCQPAAGAFFRRSAIDSVGGWNPALRQVPDFEFWLRVSDMGTFYRIPEVLASVRIHDDSASLRPIDSNRADEIIHVMDHYWRAAEHTDAKRSRGYARIISAKHHLTSGRYTIGFNRIFAAFSLSPSIAVQTTAWRYILQGLFRRLIYKSLALRVSATS